jgi:dCMP deaminase
MLVGIVGTTSSGKKTIASYLITRYKFTQLFIKPSGSDSKDSFKSLAEAVQYATSHWQERFVILSIDHYSNYGIALKRPFFLLIYVDAPVSIRYARSLSRLSTDKSSQKSTDSKIVVDLERFILRDETQLYTPFGHQIGDCLAKLLFNHQSCLYDFHNIADIRLLNNSTNCRELYMKIDDLDLLNPERLRPGWDTYFMALCELASKRSNCMKRRVGCIIVADARVAV